MTIQRDITRNPPARRGMALLVVMGLISISLALSYATLRSQATIVQLQSNTAHMTDARQAALSGLADGLREMSQSSWAGVGTTHSGWLGPRESFTVSYTTGDPALTSSHADYDDLPYRVTLLATGFAQDPDNATAIATYRIRAVTRLIPRRLADEPAGWGNLAGHTVYQWKAASGGVYAFCVECPAHIEGSVRVQQKLDLCLDYPADSDARKRLLQGLNGMRLAGNPDYRPFVGPVNLPVSETPAATRSLLTDQLGVTVNDTPGAELPNPSGANVVASYRLYPGGKVYTAQAVSAWLENTTLEPDPETNPLGFFQYNGSVSIRDNVSLRGALFVGGAGSDAYIYGKNVQFQPVNLRPIEGASMPVQIPVLVVQDDLRVDPAASASLQGMVAAGDEFEVREGGQTTINLALEGCLLCQELHIRGRLEWDQLALTWQLYLFNFELQESNAGGEPYFSNWVETQYGLRQEAKIRIKPPTQEVSYHWHDAANPIYVAHPDDGGLRWDLIDWTENPPQ